MVIVRRTGRIGERPRDHELEEPAVSSSAVPAHDRRRRWTPALSVIAALATLVAVLGLTAAPASAEGFPGNTLPSENPIDNTPRVINGQVYAILRSGNRVFVGGTFTTVRNPNHNTDITRNRLFSYSHTTGTVDTWAPNMSGTVDGDRPSRPTASGSSSPAPSSRSTGPTAVAWPRSAPPRACVTPGSPPPSPGATSNDMELRGNTLYLTGNFTSVRSVARGNLAAVNATNGAVLPLNLADHRRVQRHDHHPQEDGRRRQRHQDGRSSATSARWAASTGPRWP